MLLITAFCFAAPDQGKVMRQIEKKLHASPLKHKPKQVSQATVSFLVLPDGKIKVLEVISQNNELTQELKTKFESYRLKGVIVPGRYSTKLTLKVQ